MEVFLGHPVLVYIWIQMDPNPRLIKWIWIGKGIEVDPDPTLGRGSKWIWLRIRNTDIYI